MISFKFPPSPGLTARVHGWGMTGSNWTSCDLRSVEVGVVGAAQCGAAMSQPVTQDMICAGGVANQGACVVSASEVSRHSIQLILLHRTSTCFLFAV